MCSFLVHEAGVEPARPCEHWHLKPASLPIPPLVHQMVLRNKFLSRRDLYSSIVHLKCQQLFLEIKKLLSESRSPSLPHGEKYPHGQKGKETRTELCPLWVSLFCLAGADDGTRTRTPVAGTSTSSWPVYLFQHIRKSAFMIIRALPLFVNLFYFYHFLKKIVDNASS